LAFLQNGLATAVDLLQQAAGAFAPVFNDSGGNHSNWITGNLIGTDISGQFPLGNNGDGICIYGDRDLIGGLPAEGNVIAYNGGAGIRLTRDFDTQILGNSIYGNGGLGIDGFQAGVSPGLQDQLRIQVEANGLTFTLAAPPPGAYRVEFFGKRVCIAALPLDHGEGEFFLRVSNVYQQVQAPRSVLLPRHNA